MSIFKRKLKYINPENERSSNQNQENPVSQDAPDWYKEFSKLPQVIRDQPIVSIKNETQPKQVNDLDLTSEEVYPRIVIKNKQWFSKKSSDDLDLNQKSKTTDDHIEFNQNSSHFIPQQSFDNNITFSKYKKKLDGKAILDRASGKKILLENQDWIFYFVSKKNKSIYYFFILLFFILFIFTTLFSYYLLRNNISTTYWYVSPMFAWFSAGTLLLTFIYYLFSFLVFYKREVLYHFFIKTTASVNKHKHIYFYNLKNFKFLFNWAILILFLNTVIFVFNVLFNYFLLKHIIGIDINSINPLSINYFILIGVFLFCFIISIMLKLFLLNNIKFYSKFYNLTSDYEFFREKNIRKNLDSGNISSKSLEKPNFKSYWRN